MRRAILIILVVIGTLLVPLFWVEASGIGISPPIFELTGNPGDVIENHIEVYNPSPDMNVGVKMEVEDIAPAGEAGHVVVEPAETETYSLASWINVEPKEFTLAPKGKRIVKFTVTIPDNAEPGGHYGTVLAGTKSVAGPHATGATIVQRLGSLVLLTIPGKMREELAVEDFNVGIIKERGGKQVFSPHHYFEYGPISFEVRFKNSGSVHVKTNADITITNFWGKKVGEVRLPSGRNVLPNARRKFEVSFNKKWFWAGKYIATLAGSYGRSNTAFDTKVITFWAFPWKVAVGGLVVILFFALTRKRWAAAFRVLISGEGR